MTRTQLKAARVMVGWSQQTLAVKARVGQSTVADFERGKREPIFATLQRMKEALEAEGVIFIRRTGVRRRA